MTRIELRGLLLPATSLDAVLPFYERGMGFARKLRDGEHYAAVDAGGLTLAVATPADHPAPGQVVPIFRTDDVPVAVEHLAAHGAEVLRPAQAGPHELRALLRDPAGNLLVVSGPLPR